MGDVKGAIMAALRDGRLPCAFAFRIAKETGSSPAEIGAEADRLDVRISRCQLGLFGYKPKKKIVEPLDTLDHDLADAVKGQLIEGRLPCNVAWDIASKLGIKKMAVSRACESLKIKVKPCQLGAF